MNKKYKVPKTIEECVEVDSLSKHLWNWAHRLERYGKIVLGIIIACGFILAIYAGIVANETGEFVWGAILMTAGTWTAYAVVEYCAYYALFLLISALASVVQNTTITANIAVYSASYQRGRTADSQSVMKELGELAKRKAQGEILEDEFRKKREELLKQI